MKSINLVFVLFVTLFLSVSSYAVPKEFIEVDVNKDGFLDNKEFAKSGAESPFEEFDGNADGKVSFQEYDDKLNECE